MGWLLLLHFLFPLLLNKFKRTLAEHWRCFITAIQSAMAFFFLCKCVQSKWWFKHLSQPSGLSCNVSNSQDSGNASTVVGWHTQGKKNASASNADEAGSMHTQSSKASHGSKAAERGEGEGSHLLQHLVACQSLKNLTAKNSSEEGGFSIVQLDCGCALNQK